MIYIGIGRVKYASVSNEKVDHLLLVVRSLPSLSSVVAVSASRR